MQLLANMPWWAFYGLLVLFFAVACFWTRFCLNTANGQVVLFVATVIIGTAMGVRHTWWIGVIAWLVSFGLMSTTLPNRAPDYGPGLPESPWSRLVTKIKQDLDDKK